MAAIMAMAAAAGSRVVCVTATRGELGVTDPMRWPPEQLPAIREAELAACLAILGDQGAPLVGISGWRLR